MIAHPESNDLIYVLVYLSVDDIVDSYRGNTILFSHGLKTRDVAAGRASTALVTDSPHLIGLEDPPAHYRTTSSGIILRC